MRALGLLVLAAALGLLLVSSASAIRFTDDSYVVPVGTVGEDYNHQFEGDGGCGPELPYQFRVLSGALPPGLSLLDDGLLTGIPTRAGRWSFWLELSDEDPPSDPRCVPKKSQRLFTVDIVEPLAITPASASPATVRMPYSLALNAAGGGGTRVWSIASGQLPPGLTLNSATGAITGTPTAVGVYEFRVRVNDGTRFSSRQFTVPVREALTVHVPVAPVAEVGVPIVAVKPVATGGFGPKAWQIEGMLPSGLTLDARSGVVTGIPKMAGSFLAKLLVSDSEGRTSRINITLVVRPRLEIASTPLPAARSGHAYHAKIVALGGTGATTFKVLAGHLPAGVHFNVNNGTFSGEPRGAGQYRVVIQARDSLAAARRSFGITVR